jgi:hypothetical protein
VTIFLECIFQVCCPIYKEFLGLPLSIYIRHPLRFAVAHKKHGQQLRSGWTTPNPTSLQDREEELNNMLFETATSNWVKSDFAEDTYDQIRADLENIHIDKRFYDPNFKPAANLVDDLVINIDTLDLEDVIPGEEMDEEFLKSIQDEDGGGKSNSDSKLSGACTTDLVQEMKRTMTMLLWEDQSEGVPNPNGNTKRRIVRPACRRSFQKLGRRMYLGESFH